jgi:vitamin B12 transporter
MKKLYTALTALSLLPAVPFCRADEQAPTMMDEIVVTAARSEESTASVSAHLTVIDRDELDQSVSRNVGDLFAEKGIGHVRKYPGSLTSIGIRGFRTDTHGNDLQGHVLVLLDGRRAGTGNLAKILTRNIERIEIIRGPGAVQYGSAGMGGVVNIITRTGTSNSFFLEGGGGSFGESDGTIGATALAHGFDFAGSITYQTRGDYDTGTGETYPNTGVNYETGLSANLGYTFSDTNRAGIIITRFDVDDSGNPGYFDSPDLDDGSDKSNYSVDFKYDGATASGKYQWMARYFFGRDENSWSDPMDSNPDGWDDGLSSSNDTDQQGAQFQLSSTLGSATLTAGLDWLDYEVENSWTPKKTSYSNPAVFGLGRISFLDNRLTANIGLRYDWYSVEVSEPTGRDEDETRFTPQVGMAWMATDSLKLRARYAEAFMMPSADQLAADYDSWGSRITGNPDLDPESSATWEAGVDFNRAGLVSSLTWFHTDFQDKIVTHYQPDGSQTWINLGDATIAGFEMELGYDLGRPLDWSWEVRPYLNMTLLTTFEDDRTGRDLEYVSGTNFAAGLVVGNGEGIFCRLNVAYTGSQDVQDWQSGLYPAPVVSLDSSTVTDLTGSWRFFHNDSLGAFTLRGEVRNLFDEDYAYVMGYPLPGRSLYAGLRWEY